MCPWFLVGSTAPSPAIGMSYVDYGILDEDGGTIRSITRRFTMANVQICADQDDDGSVTFIDALLKSLGLGSSVPWKIPQREAPYRIVFRNESATYDGNLTLALTGSNPLFPNLYTATGTASLFPGEATNLPPLCVRNAATTLLLDTSGASNTTQANLYARVSSVQLDEEKKVYVVRLTSEKTPKTLYVVTIDAYRGLVFDIHTEDVAAHQEQQP